MPDILPDPLPPLDQIAFFRGKQQRISFDWTGIWQPVHASAFTVAGVMQEDILADIMSPLDQAIASGETLEMFEANLKNNLDKKGWWKPVDVAEVVDGVPTGRVKTVDLSAPWRVRTIFDTNVRSAQAAGLWRQIVESSDIFPFLKYDAVNDGLTRPEHAAWDGIIRPYNDPFWRTHYAPCGWFCRCTVLQLDDEEAEAQGVTDERRTRALAADRRVVKRRNDRGVQVNAEIVAGIDKGFAFNVGKAFRDRPAQLLSDAIEKSSPAVAQQLLKRELGSEHWDAWWARPIGSRITGVLADAMRAHGVPKQARPKSQSAEGG
jgi:SPP1 gp7 family putative phage head morphogenesis protein